MFKQVEQVVVKEPMEHISIKSIDISQESAHKTDHSTEAALLCIKM